MIPNLLNEVQKNEVNEFALVLRQAQELEKEIVGIYDKYIDGKKNKNISMMLGLIIKNFNLPHEKEKICKQIFKARDLIVHEYFMNELWWKKLTVNGVNFNENTKLNLEKIWLLITEIQDFICQVDNRGTHMNFIDGNYNAFKE